MINFLPTIVLSFVPLVGVILLQWQLYDVLFIFWAETTMMSIFSAAWTATCHRFPENIIFATGKGLFFGAFLFVHLLLITFITVGDSGIMAVLKSASHQIVKIILPIILIAGSYAVTFIRNYDPDNSWAIRKTSDAFTARMAIRIIFMHFSLVLGFTLSIFTKSPMPVLVLLISIQVFFDIFIYKYGQKQVLGEQ